MPSGTHNTSQLTLTGTAAQIVPQNGTRQQVTIRVVTASSTVYVGGPNVKTTNGQIIKDTDTVPYTTPTTDAIWGVTGGGSIVVAYDEVNQD